jgi:hypothetical protein
MQDLGAIPSPAENNSPLFCVPPYSVPINSRFLNKCYIYFRNSKFLAKECPVTILLWCRLIWRNLHLRDIFCPFVLDFCQMLDFPRFAGNTSSLGWFARLAGPLLSTTRQVFVYHSVPALDKFCISCFLRKSPVSNGEKYSPPAEPVTSGKHKYNGVLPGAPRGSLTALLSPPQCHAALSTIPHTLAWVNHCPC